MNTKMLLSTAALAIALPGLVAAQSQGKVQLAEIIGVEPELFTLSELVSLDRALEENDDAVVETILSEAGSDTTVAELEATGESGETRLMVDEFFDRDYETGKQQIADIVGVPADEFTLAQLIRLDGAIRRNETAVVEAVLTEAGVEMTTSDVMN